MNERNESLKLPLVSAVLTATLNRYDESIDVYSQFLAKANEAVKDSKDCNIYINGSSSCQFKKVSSNIDTPNVSLIVIYNHYAMKYEPEEKNADVVYKDPNRQIDLSFQGMEIFCYEFGIIPKFISRAELISIWRSMSLSRIQAKQTPILYLSFEMFQELLIRIAIHAFNSKELLKTLKGKLSTYPSSEEAVIFLCHFLKLDHEVAIRKKIKAFGKKYDDVRQKKAASEKVLIEELLSVDDVPKVNLKKTIFSSLSTTSLIVGKTRKPPPRPFTSDTSTYLKVKPKPNFIPDHIEKSLKDVQNEIQQIRPETTVTLPELGPKRKTGHDLDDDSTNIFAEEVLPVLRYEKYLLRFFDKYRVKKEEIFDFDFHETNGPFFDLGFVVEGLIYKLKLVITNNSKDILNFDVTTSDFNSEDVTVVTLPGPIVQGLSRVVHISFTVPEGLTSILGFVHIHAISIRNFKKKIISCPVHYRVVKEGQSVPNKKKCTMKNLATLTIADNYQQTLTSVKDKTLMSGASII